MKSLKSGEIGEEALLLEENVEEIKLSKLF